MENDNATMLEMYENLTPEQKARLGKLVDELTTLSVKLVDDAFDTVAAGLHEKAAALYAMPEIKAVRSGEADVDGECETVTLVAMHALTLVLFRRFFQTNPTAGVMALKAAGELASRVRTTGEMAEQAAEDAATGGLFQQAGRPARS